MSSIDILQKILSETSSSSPLYCRNELNNKNVGIRSKYISDFYKTYCDALDIIEEDVKFSYYERVSPETMMPLIIEFKFKIEEIDTESAMSEATYQDDIFYKHTFEPRMVQLVQELISENFKVSPGSQELLCCVLNTIEDWKEKNYLCKYVRLQFPFCVTDQTFIYETFRRRLLKKLKKSNLHAEFPRQPKGEWKDFLLLQNDYYPLYGSNFCKRGSKIDMYNFYGPISNYENPLILNDKIYENVNSFFDIEKHSKICKYGENSTWEQYEGREYIEHYLPIILSLHYYDKFVEKINDTGSVVSKKEIDSQSVATDDSDIESVKKVKKDSLLRCKDILEMINSERMQKQDFIRDLGKIMYNETDGGKRGFDEWKTHMIDYNLKDGPELQHEYYTHYENQPYTWETLAWYAHIDSPDAFKQWQQNWALETMREIINAETITEVDVAKLFHKFNMFDFMYENKTWYQYNERENRLMKLKGNEGVLEKMTTLSEFLANFGKSQNKMASEAKDYFKAQKEVSSVLSIVGKLANKLKTTAFRTKIATEAKVFFLRRELPIYMDANQSLLCTKNNILDLGEKYINVRKGKPEDFISKTTGVKYFKGQTDAIKKYLREVFPEDEVYEFVLRDVSSFLLGKNSEKKFRSWIGDTNGSKSIFQKIILKMLGSDYCVALPIEAFKKKSGGSGPNPEIAQLKNARIGFVNEPDNTDTFSAGIIKTLSSGGDLMFGRGCGQDGGAIEMNAKIILVMNSVPKIEGADNAIFNRMMMTPFESQWFDEDDDKFKLVPESFEEQIKKKMFFKDTEYDKKVGILAQQLLTLAVENYPSYKKNKLKMPKYIDKFIKNFWEKNDPIIEFIEDALIKTDVEKDVVSSKKVFNAYKEWMRTNKPSHLKSIMDRKPLIDILKNPRYLGKSENDAWNGYKVKVEDIEEE